MRHVDWDIRRKGRAWVTGESVYHFDPADPFRNGIPSSL